MAEWGSVSQKELVYSPLYKRAPVPGCLLWVRTCLKGAASPENIASGAQQPSRYPAFGPRVWAGTSRRPWLVAIQATLPQKWPPPLWNVADSCEVTETKHRLGGSAAQQVPCFRLSGLGLRVLVF